jgi:hypothetical protein
VTDIMLAGEGAFGVVGLEDFDESDLIMPTLRLGANQDAGFIINNLSGEKLPSLQGVVLGIVKGRVLWNADISEEKSFPLCKSYDFHHGYPNMKEFPWRASGFPAPAVDASQTVLNCGDCPLKEWGTHPKNESPWCGEQHNYVILQKVNGVMVPAILTLQRTGLTPSRKYMNSFAQSKSPMFVCVTEITLETQRRGSVDYTVPTLRRGVDIDPQFYQDFANQFRRIRATLQTPRVADDEGEPVAAPQSNTYTPTPAAPTPQPAPQPAAPAQDAAPAAQTAPSVPDPAPVPEPNAEPAEDAPIVPDAVTPAPSAAPAASGEPGDGDLPF